MSFFRPSGGLIYHWRAWRHRARWREFRDEVAAWLEEWPRTSDELLLIGPSAGYTLPTAWLRQFRVIHAFDLDPMAPFFFRRQHPGVNVKFHREDVFWDGEEFNTERLRPLLRAHPDAMILLSNVLGQLLLEHVVPDRAWDGFLRDLRSSLIGRDWASYHDLYTHEDGEVIDHLTGGEWKDGLDTRQFRWELSDKSMHLIEGVRG